MKTTPIVAAVCITLMGAITVVNAAQTNEGAVASASLPMVANAPLNVCPANTPAWPIYQSLTTQSSKETSTSVADYHFLIGEFRFCNAGGYGLDARLLMNNATHRADGYVFCGEAVAYADNGITSATQAQVKNDAKVRKANAFEWYYSDQSPRSLPSVFTNTYNNTGKPQYVVGEAVTGYARTSAGSDPRQVQQECMKMTQDLANDKAAEVLQQRTTHQRP